MFYTYLPKLTKNKDECPIKHIGGFGLIELMVTVSILALVTGIVLTKQSSFNGAVLLRSQAYEVALALREVQLSAVSSSGDTGSFRGVRGLHFDTSNLADGQFLQFEDGNGDRFYDVGEDYGPVHLLADKFEIRAIRPSEDTISGTELSVVFLRPNFDAMFYDNNGRVDTSSVEIDISRRGVTADGVGNVRTVEITATGQIAVH